MGVSTTVTAMGKGGNEPKCGSKAIWGGLTACRLLIGLLSLILGSYYTADCGVKANDCKDDNLCSAACAANGAGTDCSGGCWTETCGQLGISTSGTISSGYGGTVSLGDSASKFCDYISACQCDNTRGGIAGIAIGIIFLILSCVFCCGIVPCLCFDGGPGPSDGSATSASC